MDAPASNVTLPPPPTPVVKPPYTHWWPYIVLFMVLSLAGYSFYRLSLPPAEPNGAGYAAIAYSPSTGTYGSSSHCGSIADAEHLALSRCHEADAKIVIWSHDAWCALAVGEDKTYGVGSGNSSVEAEHAALTHCRLHTTTQCRVEVAVSSRGTEAAPATPNEGEGTYAAIAYSPSTGAFGSARECRTLAEAEHIALSGCNEPDAKIVIWAHKAWCALAVADDRSYGYSWGRSAEAVEQAALTHCRQFAKTPCHVAVVVFAGSAVDRGGVVLSPGAGAAHTIALSQFPSVGKSVTVKRVEKSFASFNVDLGSKGDVLQNEEDIKRRVFTLTVLDGGEERPRKYVEFYEKAEKDVDGKPAPLSYQGQSVRYEWVDGRYKVTVDGGNIAAKDLKDLETQANTPHLESVMAPAKPVRVGEIWSIDIGKLAQALGRTIIIDEANSTATCELLKVYDKDGRKFGLLRVKYDVAVARLGAMGFDPPLNGRLEGTLETAVDGSTPAGNFIQNATTGGQAIVDRNGVKLSAKTIFTYKSDEERSGEK
jgi:hypothetical protein